MAKVLEKLVTYWVTLFTVLLSITTTSNAATDTKNGTYNTSNTIPINIIAEIVEDVCPYSEPEPTSSEVLNYKCYGDADKSNDIYENYTLELVPLVFKDFNQDGITDIALKVRSLGPLGASITTNSSVDYLLLDKDGHIDTVHSILLYAPFSEHIVDYQVKNERIYYEAEPNYRSNSQDFDENGRLLVAPTVFSIMWIDGVPISTHYQDSCALYHTVDKRIFHPSKDADRFVGIDMHNYEQVVTEYMTVRTQYGRVDVDAALMGCNVRQVHFDITPVEDGQLPLLADVLQLLRDNTVYDEPLKKLLELDDQFMISFGEVMSLNDHWSGRVHLDRSPKSSYIRVSLYEQVP